MGLIPAPTHCYFTGYPATDFEGTSDSIDYWIDINNRRVPFSLKSSEDWTSSKFIDENKHILFGDIFNFRFDAKNKILTILEVEKMIKESTGPKTPKDRLDNLFLTLCKRQKSDGEEVEIFRLLDKQEFYRSLYFKNSDELNFYIKALADDDLVNVKLSSDGYVFTYTITFKGLNYEIDLTETGLNSNKCFVAMSFGENMNEIRKAIKSATIETGFTPILIDELHVDSEKTINDEIIASIKKSKFCIADFTEQKDGVYFEAGYALGRGLKVIYTCHRDWFNKTHFDTNHFPHIIYTDPNDLSAKLKLKIEAWVQ